MKWKEKIFKRPWPYWIGGIVLALLNVLLLLRTGKAWRVTTGFLYCGMGILEKIGCKPSAWYYCHVYDYGLKQGQSFMVNEAVILDIAMITGAFLAVLLASEFKWKKIKGKKQLFYGLLGGILMGYGSRLSFGCNIGAYFSAIPSFSLHGWIFTGFMFLGAWIGSKILFKYIL